MDELARARESINEADSGMAALFERRMKAVREIAAWKQERGLPILDEDRERAVLERNSSLVGEELRPYYVSFLRALMDLSKEYQRRLIGGARVAYAGVEGAFAGIAARRAFPYARALGFADFAAAYRAVEAGECERAVLPIENSCAGPVDQVMGLMFEGSLRVTGICVLPVVQNLLALPGAALSGIRTVYSHPLALRQCEGFLWRNALQAVPEGNTAVAARRVAEMGDMSAAAIASEETAALYGLNILARGVNDSAANATRFAVFSREDSPASEGGRCVLLFAVRDEAGALARAINIISGHGFNLKILRGRPDPDCAGRCVFYAEAEGGARDEEMLEELSAQCERLRAVGRGVRELEL